MSGPNAIGLDGRRVYLDWNATAPLRPEARAAMLQAMDVVGNPSSVHAEGRAAKAILTRAREQVAGLVGCDPDEVVFTSGATEAAATVLAQVWDAVLSSDVEHDCIAGPVASRSNAYVLTVDASGDVSYSFPDVTYWGARRLCTVPVANGETGGWVGHQVVTDLARADGFAVLADATQAVGKRYFNFSIPPAESKATYAIISAHKLGGPKGSGALIVRNGAGLHQFLRGGGQERGRRAGTENVIGIAGFGAAAAAAQRDLKAGVWERVALMRDRLEERLSEVAPDLIIFGKGAERLPNTSCFAVPGWAGETQVMQMDLAGFAVSAGSACSSGKVKKASRVLMAMGFDEVTASSALRVSMGWTTIEAEVDAFATAWIEHYERRMKNTA
jgi:cysteine desulfurase